MKSAVSSTHLHTNNKKKKKKKKKDDYIEHFLSEMESKLEERRLDFKRWDEKLSQLSFKMRDVLIYWAVCSIFSIVILYKFIFLLLLLMMMMLLLPPPPVLHPPPPRIKLRLNSEWGKMREERKMSKVNISHWTSAKRAEASASPASAGDGSCSIKMVSPPPPLPAATITKIHGNS